MSKTNKSLITDIEECKVLLNQLLRKYNCSLMSVDEWSRVLLIDNDTNQTLLAEDN
jgi:hypothetical protein